MKTKRSRRTYHDEKKTSDWEDLSAEAICSGIDIPEFCSLHGLFRNWFYRMAMALRL